MEESVCVGIREAVKCVKFRPYGNVQNSNNQNNLVVAASREGTVMAWDLTDTPISNQQGTRMFVPNCAFQGPAEAISLEWSRQGKVFACTFVDGTVVLFEC
jgi:WD40 repeat protein